MPEITNVETIRTKLREFDERMDGAIEAAKVLSRIRSDAENLLKKIEGDSAIGKESLRKADAIRQNLQNLQNEWNSLEKKVEKSNSESIKAADYLRSEFDAAIQSLDKKVVEAEERLLSSNNAALAEHEESLKRLDASIRANAECVTSAKDAVLGKADDLDRLLGSLRNDLQNEIESQIVNGKESLDSQVHGIQNEMQEKIDNLTKSLGERSEAQNRHLQNEMSLFKEEMKKSLIEHQQSVDRQLTEFLQKQNVLVQNLNQQVDSFQRVSQTSAKEIEDMKSYLITLAKAFNEHKSRTLNELNAGLESTMQKISANEDLIAGINARFDETLEKLRELPMVGKRFK